jgi:large subunit ribosomal protein L6
MISIKIPKDIVISWGEHFVKVTGSLGTVKKKKSGFDLVIKDSNLYIIPENNDVKLDFYTSLLNSLIIGVSKGYRQKLKLVGVGFKVSVVENSLKLKIGFSHEVLYAIPEDVKILVSNVKGNLILIKGKEKQRVSQIASEIRGLRVPDAYKGKGIQYYNEVLKLKKGKSEGK